MHIDFLIDVFKEFENTDAVIWGNKKFNYKSLMKNINKSELFIESHKIKSGTVVAIIGDFSPNSIALLLALI